MTEAIGLQVHRFSNEAFGAARAFATEPDGRDAAKASAAQLLAELPAMAALAKTASAELQPDLNRALSEARLDLTYIQSDGRLPRSMRLGRLLIEAAAEQK